jgi:tRNA nucleotidyltransferase (CCA-adding enzyme)
VPLCFYRFSGSVSRSGVFDTIVHMCADGGRALVSVVVFGSAAIGGWVENVSDVDLILVVPDAATDEDMGRLRSEPRRIVVAGAIRSTGAGIAEAEPR